VSANDWALLQALTDQSFANGAFRQTLRPAFNAVGKTGQDVAGLATQAQAAADAASGSLATQLALGTPANGVGNEPMDLPRMMVLNSGGFQTWDMAMSLHPNTQNATYQITPHDAGKLLLCTSGTRTWTLPVATDVWIGWTCRLRNRSGATLTLNTGAATDAINGGTAGVGITVATGSAILTAVCTGSASFEVA
jgi:hypothetical protein